jgi:flavin-dependent dehydrogenase
MLLKTAEAYGAHVLPCDRLEICHGPYERTWKVDMQFDGKSVALAAKWAIDATGRSAWLSRRLGVRKYVSDRLTALILLSADSAVRETRTVIEASSTGWWYFAPLPNRRVVTAFFTDSDLLPRHKQELPEFWIKRLAETQLISTILPTIAACSSFRIVAAATAKLERAAGDDWLAVGDAAQSYDPLSGQGVARALTSGMAAACAITQRNAGDTHAFDVFAENADQEFKRYQGDHRANYAREKRWQDSEFWNRRR